MRVGCVCNMARPFWLPNEPLLWSALDQDAGDGIVALLGWGTYDLRRDRSLLAKRFLTLSPFAFGAREHPREAQGPAASVCAVRGAWVCVVRGCAWCVGGAPGILVRGVPP